jgi:hypothetical protein
MKLFISATLALLTVFVFAFLINQTASAEKATPFYWEYINVDINVQENGDMLVIETQKYVFTAPHTNERYRWLPLDKVDGIDRVEVYKEGRTLSVTTGAKGNQLWINWRHPLSPPESQTFVLKYRVMGGLHLHDDGDQVYWKALFKDRTTPIQSGKVIVHLPDSVAGRITGFKAFGVAADSRQLDAQTAEFVSRGPLSPGKALEVQVTFPHGILDVPVPAWQQSAAQGTVVWRNMAVVFSVPMLVLFVVVGLAILAIILFFSGQCPQCGRYHSFKKTGMTRRVGGMVFGATYDEQRCIDCGYTDWVERPSSQPGGCGGASSGGGGDGGGASGGGGGGGGDGGGGG